MKKFLSSIFLFILSLGVFYALYLLLWGAVIKEVPISSNLNYKIGSYGHLYSRLEEVKTKKDIDLLFLGSSHTYRGFDTRFYSDLNIDAFNLGSSAQTPIQTKVLLNRYLDQLNPKLVIYEVFPSTFTFDGAESSLDIIANDRNDFNSFLMALKINNAKVYNTFLYGLTNDILGTYSSFNEVKKRGSHHYIPGGFVERKVTYFKTKEHSKRKWYLKESQLEEFNTILNLLKERNIPYILVQAPFTKNLYNSYTNNDVFDSKMKDLGEYYNFNEMMHLNDSLHFYDQGHLNQLGVEKFNLFLIDTLSKASPKFTFSKQ